MKTIRRLYFYAIAFISVEIVLWGVINLLRSMLGNTIVDSASALAQALSLILVGVPIFLVHWLWAQRASAKDDEEKIASLRAVFLYGILLGALIPVVQNLLALINRAFLSAANLYVSRAVFGGTQTWTDNLIAIVINLLIAAYFWNVLQGEWKTIPEKENFAEVRRLARFIWMLYGLIFVVYGAQQALDYAFTLSAQNVLGAVGGETAVNAVAMLLIGAPIWFCAWKMLQDALADSSERESMLRLVILYLLALGGVVTVLTAGGNLLYRIILQVLGYGTSLPDFIQNIGGPISIGVPFGVIWAYYGNWLHQQFSFDEDAPRRASKQRLYFYILSFLGLFATFFAVVSLFALVIELLTVENYLSASGFGDSLASALAFLAAGLPLWLLTWRPIQFRASESGKMGDHERRSVIRKTYLYLVLFISVIGVMISAGGLIFSLINAALGGDTTHFVNSILNTLQTLSLFIVLLAYHLFALRKDGELRADELEAKQKGFNVAILDHDGKFGAALKAAFAKRAPDISLNIVDVNALPADLNPNAILFSSQLLISAPKNAEAWMRSFGGIKLAVEEDAADLFWMNDAGHAVDSARALAEGQQIQPRAKGASAWMYVMYVFAGLFAIQFLFMLIIFAVSLVTGF
jgi:hypothetical protein